MRGNPVGSAPEKRFSRYFFCKVRKQILFRKHLRAENSDHPVIQSDRIDQHCVHEFGLSGHGDAGDDVQTARLQREVPVQLRPAGSQAARIAVLIQTHDPIPEFTEAVQTRHRHRFRRRHAANHLLAPMFHQHVIDILAVGRIAAGEALSGSEPGNQLFFQTKAVRILVGDQYDLLCGFEYIHAVHDAFAFFVRRVILHVRCTFIHGTGGFESALHQRGGIEFPLGDVDGFRIEAMIDVPAARFRVLLLGHVLARITVFHIQQFAIAKIGKRHHQRVAVGRPQILYGRKTAGFHDGLIGYSAQVEICPHLRSHIRAYRLRCRTAVDFPLRPVFMVFAFMNGAGPAAMVALPDSLVAVDGETGFMFVAAALAALRAGRLTVTVEPVRQVDAEIPKTFHNTTSPCPAASDSGVSG